MVKGDLYCGQNFRQYLSHCREVRNRASEMTSNSKHPVSWDLLLWNPTLKPESDLLLSINMTDMIECHLKDEIVKDELPSPGYFLFLLWLVHPGGS